MSQNLFSEFPPVSTETWRQVVDKDLKGADYEKRLVKTTLDGLRLHPMYRAEDLPANLDPERRTTRRGWDLREEIREPDLAAANGHALRSLNRGAEEIAFYVYPLGPKVHDQPTFTRVLEDIWIQAIPIHWICGPLAPVFVAMLKNAVARRGLDPAEIRGSVDTDPLMDRLARWTDAPLATWADDTISLWNQIYAAFPNYTLLTVRGSFIEKSGASLAQELGLSLSLLDAYLDAAKSAAEQGRLNLGGADVTDTLNRLVERTELRLGVGTNYFLEIAKLRAARSLTAEILNRYGVTARPKIHVITTSSNKTLYDPYNNLLRGTIEAAAAVIGGADSLTVAAYDQGYHAPDEFSEHLARNTDNLLLEEAQLGRVADPLGGSYTVEALTHSIGEAARGVMAAINEAGGMVGAAESGWIDAELNRVKAARALQVSTRRRTIVGTTVYPNLKEQRLDDVESRPVPRQITGLAAADLDGLARTMAAGGDIKHHIAEAPCPSTAFDSFRPSWPYEHLRLRTERHARTGGKVPLIFLAKLGDVTMRQARAAFCLGFFGAAGYRIHEAAFESADVAAQAAEQAGADLLVLCSSDAEYLALATGLKTTIPVVVAGLPTEHVEALKAVGIADFVHIRQDIALTLEQWHTRFHIPLIPLDEPLNPAPREVNK